jgi:hypothetical protein
MNEEQNFLDEFKPNENDPFAFIENQTEEVKKEEPVEETSTEPEPRNRRERRLMEKLQAEREAAIALAAKLEAITQSQQARSEQAEFLSVAERIYGTQTPELREATELLKTALLGVKEEAKREALSEYQLLRQKEQEAIINAEKRIESLLEEIEEKHNTDLSENSAHRTGFLKLLEKMSPKDSNGKIIEYADHHAVWEVYQDKVNRSKPTNPAKDISSRTMVESNQSKDGSINNDATLAWLKENGIL